MSYRDEWLLVQAIASETGEPPLALGTFASSVSRLEYMRPVPMEPLTLYEPSTPVSGDSPAADITVIEVVRFVHPDGAWAYISSDSEEPLLCWVFAGVPVVEVLPECLRMERRSEEFGRRRRARLTHERALLLLTKLTEQQSNPHAG